MKVSSLRNNKNVDQHFVTKLFTAQTVSRIYNVLQKTEYNITSHYRSPEHNKKVGGSADSMHLQGRAADISYQTSHECYIILAGCIGIFNTVIVYDNHIHVDDREREFLFLTKTT